MLVHLEIDLSSAWIVELCHFSGGAAFPGESLPSVIAVRDLLQPFPFILAFFRLFRVNLFNGTHIDQL